MTWWHPHPDAARIVRDHWKEADLVIIAHRPPCIKVRDDELANLNRVVKPLSADELRRWAPKRRPCWMAAVLVCEGDDLAPLASAVKSLRLPADRFHFYLHKEAPVLTLRPWVREGLSLDHVDTGIADWKALHSLLGMDFNVRIVEDFLPAGEG